MKRWPSAGLCRWCGLLAILAALWISARAQDAVLDLSGAPVRIALTDRLRVLHDADARLEPWQALSHPGWQPATTRASPGNHPRAVTAADNAVARNGCDDLPAFQNSTLPSWQPLASRWPAF